MNKPAKHDFLSLADAVKDAVGRSRPVTALESTVITHGLPYPENKKIALEMEQQVRGTGAIPATVAVLDGMIKVGISGEELEKLASSPGLQKISSRDLGAAVAKNWSGGTTVAGTMVAAQMAGIQVFATGGIGGVHRAVEGVSYDISADLKSLASIRMIVVCAGAKAILDLPATVEYLETNSVPVVGYRTDEFPAFYSRSSGSGVSVRADSPEEVVEIALAHWGVGAQSALLVVNPLPEDEAVPAEEIEEAVQKALGEIDERGISGQAVTPFLLARVSELTGGHSLESNLVLLRNNARLGGEIATAMSAIQENTGST